MALPSTAPRAPPGVLNEIYALLSWDPPLLSLDPDKKPSSASRLPGFYDKHFSEQFVLKKVEPLPSLVPDLAKNVRNALRAALPNLPPLGDDFITAAQRKSERRRYARVAKDEKAVANVYDKYAANYCLPLASTLALHPTASFSEWSSLLRWTQSVSSEGFATWEMKSLGGEVMSAVPNLGTFSWTFCNVMNCHEVLKRAGEVVAGPDAQDPPWSLPSTSSFVHHHWDQITGQCPRYPHSLPTTTKVRRTEA
jgi:hypothetical protein